MEHQWLVASEVPETVINKFPELHPVVLQLLYNRGLKTQSQIDEFTNPDYGQDIHDPFLFRDMAKARQRIINAIKEKERIIVHGDYDADGVCSAAVIVSALKIIDPDCRVNTYLPHREIEGYGINMDAVDNFSKNKTKLIITTDCGTSNIEEIKKANRLGIDVIVTDHHSPHSELPPAYAIINPWLDDETYPFKNLSGTGVAFKLAQALLKNSQAAEAQEKWLLDLVALGTIADYVPLLGENRTLVKYGLIVLKKTRRVGLQKLFEILRIKPEKLDARTIAFQIIPKLNAAGRVDHANTAYELITTGLKEEAAELAFNLNQLNQERQRITDRITQEALVQIGQVSREQYILFAEGRDWPAGLVGLVASKIMDQHNRPAFVIGRRQDLIIGSGRSLPEFHLANSLKILEKYFSHYGGHRQACGFTLKKDADLTALKHELNNLAAAALKNKDLRPKINLDAEIGFEKIDWDLVEALEKFQPFGEGNPTPRFLTRRLQILDWETVGNDKKHLRLVVRDRSMITRRLIGFGFGNWSDKLTSQDTLDAVYEVGVNEWNGTRELQMKLIDLKFSK